METVFIRSKPYILGRLDDQPFRSPLVVARAVRWSKLAMIPGAHGMGLLLRLLWAASH